ncbi:ABC transporter substrate-binding protein [Amycolatopsis sp. TRM77291]
MMRSSRLRHKRFSTVLGSLLGAAVLLSTSACGALGGDSDPAPGRIGAVKVTAMQVLDTGPLRHAIARGYFTEAGLSVSLVDADSGQVGITKLNAGEVNLAYAGDVAIITAVANSGLDLRIVAEAAMAGPKHMWIMVRNDGSVRSVAELAGRRIAHNGNNGVSHMLTRTVMATHRVDASTVKWTTAKFPDMAGLLARNEVDAALLTEPYIGKATKLGLMPLIDPVAGGGFEQAISTGSYVATGDWARQHPAEIAAFQTVLRRAAAEATTNPGLVRDIAVTDLKVDPADAQTMTMPLYPLASSAPQLQRWADLMHTQGVIGHPVRMADLIIAPPPNR